MAPHGSAWPHCSGRFRLCGGPHSSPRASTAGWVRNMSQDMQDTPNQQDFQYLHRSEIGQWDLDSPGQHFCVCVCLCSFVTFVDIQHTCYSCWHLTLHPALTGLSPSENQDPPAVASASWVTCRNVSALKASLFWGRCWRCRVLCHGVRCSRFVTWLQQGQRQGQSMAIHWTFKRVADGSNLMHQKRRLLDSPTSTTRPICFLTRVLSDLHPTTSDPFSSE